VFVYSLCVQVRGALRGAVGLVLKGYEPNSLYTNSDSIY